MFGASEAAPMCFTCRSAPRPYNSLMFALDKDTWIPFDGAVLQVFLSAGVSSTPPDSVSYLFCCQDQPKKSKQERTLYIDTPGAHSVPWPFCISRPCDSCDTSLDHSCSSFPLLTETWRGEQYSTVATENVLHLKMEKHRIDTKATYLLQNPRSLKLLYEMFKGHISK